MIPRPEYPRPQFTRAEWLCLNGEWQFEPDTGDSGEARGLRDRPLSGRIVVPFCPESPLSGIGQSDFCAAVWYRRAVSVPPAWAGRRVRLHFGAVDYEATVWVDDAEVARHTGGFTPFAVTLPEAITGGSTFTIVVRARDDHRVRKPMGKQSTRYENHGCHYTRTTGIWQTVWLEPLAAAAHLERPRITPVVEAGAFLVETRITGRAAGTTLALHLCDASGAPVTSASLPLGRDGTATTWLALPAAARRLWSPRDPHLYRLTFELRASDGAVLDRVESYAGLRGVAIDGTAILLNGERLFQRLVLDQGYYPDGILTAPTAAALRRDIELAQAVGFNGARLHEKVFEERFLYHADQLGYLVWGEFPDWPSLGWPHPELATAPWEHFVTQWLEALECDYSHPCIVGWCPLNETASRHEHLTAQIHALTHALYAATKAADRTRPVIDASGWSHRLPEVDVYDAHDYEQDPAKLAAKLADLAAYGAAGAHQRPNVAWRGQPFFLSEFGGTWWNPAAAAHEPSWGYGERPRTEAEFLARFAGLCDTLLRHPQIAGYCYTQLTDVFQEQNGLYTFDRQPKFDAARLRTVQQAPAAIEG
jgi:beta-galactosidase/beta-glucuronidase